MLSYGRNAAGAVMKITPSTAAQTKLPPDKDPPSFLSEHFYSLSLPLLELLWSTGRVAFLETPPTHHDLMVL